MTTQQPITGQLDPKRVNAYVMKSHKQFSIRVEPDPSDDLGLLVSNGAYLCFRVPLAMAMTAWQAQDVSWKRWTFPTGSFRAEEGGVDQAAFFRSWGTTISNHVLTVTNDLREIPVGGKDKPGQLYRKFFFMGSDNAPDEVYSTPVYIARELTDLLSPDLDALSGFRFETSGQHKPVRVSGQFGIIGYIMPAVHVDQSWNGIAANVFHFASTPQERRDQPFLITSLTRSDLIALGYSSKQIDRLTDAQMEHLARKMSEDYGQQLFWEHLEAFVTPDIAATLYDEKEHEVKA